MSTGAPTSAVAQRLDVVDGDGRVFVAEQPEPRRLQLTDAVDERRELREAAGDDAAAVETDGRAETALEGHHERDPPAEAEPDDRDVVVGEPGRAQVVERGVDVGEHCGVAASPSRTA